MGDVSMVCPRPLLIDKPFLKFYVSTNVSTGIYFVSTGQEYQPGTPGIYLVVEYFERFWGVN